MKDNKISLSQIIDFRIQKLNELKSSNINPYPYKYEKSHKIEDIIKNAKKMLNKNLSIAGRIISLRKMGKVTFLNIQDSTNSIQLFIKKDNLLNDFYDTIVKKLDIGDFIGSKGELFYTKTNELSIRSSSIEILSKSIRHILG